MAIQSQVQSFQDRNFFPAFSDCPYEHDYDERYFQNIDPEDPNSGGAYRKHWCLLGEIIKADTLIRPRIVARDYKGDLFVVAFYPDEPEDMPRLLKDFKVGNTIALFYAFTHHFLDGSTGVRVEDSDKVLIIPLNMSEVIAMNEQMTEYTSSHGTPAKCHGCDEPNEKLGKCGRCMLFSYCNKECQVKAWKEKSHNRICKALNNKGVRKMHFFNYGVYAGDVSLH